MADEPRGVFVVGTDTDAGKTVIASALARMLKNMGVDVAVFKPLESDCDETPSGLMPHDAVRLADAAGNPDSMEDVCPFRYKAPLAPAIAAREEGGAVTGIQLKERFEALSKKHEFVIVEAAGGLFVPATEDAMIIDLVALFGLPTLLVGRNRLGTINHTLLSLHLLENRNIEVAGVLLNRSISEAGPDEATNAAIIAENTKVPVLGVFPYVERESMDDYNHLAAALQECAPALSERLGF